MKPKTGKIEDECAYATDCQLATLGELIMRKSSPSSSICRQRDICFSMLKVCQEHASEIDWGHDTHWYHNRVRDLLEEAQSKGLAQAFTRFVIDRFDRPEDAAKWVSFVERYGS